MQCFSTLYLHDGDLWCSIIHGSLSKPKCRLPLKRVSQPLVCAAHSPAGMLPGGSTAWTWWELGVATQAHGQAALVPQGHDGILTSLPPPAPAQPLGEVGGEATASLHFLHVTRPPVCSWRGLSWGHKVSTFHQLLPGWACHHIFLLFSYS